MDNTDIRRMHAEEGFKCPHCDGQIIICDWHDCPDFAIYDCWVRRGGLVVRMSVCPVHLRESIGWQEGRRVEQ